MLRDPDVLICFVCLSTLLDSTFLVAAQRTWIGGNADWNDGGATTNWSPADEPDSDDEAIFNTANSVNLGSNNSISGLTMSGGIDLSTNDFDLDVNGTVQLSGASTNLFVGGNASTLSPDAVTLNSGGKLNLNGGTVTVIEEAGDGFLDIIAGGELLGYGTVTMNDAVAAGTTLIVNNGTISARRTPFLIFGVPDPGTLSLNASDGDARIDLDGNSENGVVNVNRNQTLDVNIQLADSFSGTMNLVHNSTLAMSFGWVMNTSGVINVDNGLVSGSFPNPTIPADVAFISGANFTQQGGTINVLDSDGTLRFNTNFTMNSGTLNNNGLVIFDGNATIAAGANFNMGSGTSSLTVEANRTLLIQQTNFNLDGPVIGNGTVITVNSGGSLTITSNDYDSDAIVNAFNAVINLNSGTMVTNTGDAEFVMDGILNMNNTTGVNAFWNGEPLDIGNDSGTLNAILNITGPGNHDFGAQVDFNSDAKVEVAAGSTLRFLSTSTVNFDTVNGGNNAEFTGAGSIVFDGPVNVHEAVTLNMVGGSIDLDGTDSTGDFINIDAPFTINVATLNSFGKINLGGGTNTLDVNNSVGTGVLTVHLDNPAGEWGLNAQGVMNLANDNVQATLLAGSDVNLIGTVNVTGDVRTTARVDILGAVNIQTLAEPFRIDGGNLESDPNTIAGGVINGPGVLNAGGLTSLFGFGTINATVDFDGASELMADNGTLTVNGAIADVGQIGTADSDGTLNVVNAWNSNVSTGVQLKGGTLSGGTITNDAPAGISGHGLVTARVINNTQLFATFTDSLIFETAANDNDWDGSTNTGQIVANGADIELRDTATFGFTGTVRAATGHKVFTNGFALDFNPGSSLQLGSSGTYESTNSTDIGGTVTVAAGGDSTIRVEDNRFLTFQSTSNTTLNANLVLDNNNIDIDAGATFSGPGALIIPDGSHLVVDDGATVNVLLVNEGTFRPSGFSTAGSITVKDYNQSSNGELIVDLDGTLLNQYDRILASGSAQVDGDLLVDLAGGFNPALGSTFDILSASFVVSGQFSTVDYLNLPAGKAFHIDYLSNTVRLTVVNKPFFSADFDEDGDVDATDLAIWQGAFHLNQLGDADGDNDSDGRDFLIWQQQFGSVPLAAVTQAVPEPSAVLLILLPGLLITLRRSISHPDKAFRRGGISQQALRTNYNLNSTIPGQ